MLTLHNVSMTVEIIVEGTPGDEGIAITEEQARRALVAAAKTNRWVHVANPRIVHTREVEGDSCKCTPCTHCGGVELSDECSPALHDAIDRG